MHGERHHARVHRALRVEAVELILAAREPLLRRVVLDDHHRDVVELERVRDRDEGARRRLDLVGLIVVDPVGDVLDALLGEEVERLPRLGEAGPEPAAGRLAGEVAQELDGLPDGRALIGQEVHRALHDAMGHEFPSRVQHRWRVAGS